MYVVELVRLPVDLEPEVATLPIEGLILQLLALEELQLNVDALLYETDDGEALKLAMLGLAVVVLVDPPVLGAELDPVLGFDVVPVLPVVVLVVGVLELVVELVGALGSVELVLSDTVFAVVPAPLACAC